MEHTEKLRDLTIRWKNSVGASYDDMADIFNCSKSLQTKLQQAKEGLEFYAVEGRMEDGGEKAREKLEIINKG